MLDNLLNSLQKASSDIAAATSAATSTGSQQADARKNAFMEGLRSAKQITSLSGEAFYSSLYDQTGGQGPFYDQAGKPLDVPGLPSGSSSASTTAGSSGGGTGRQRRRKKATPLPSFTGGGFVPETIVAAGRHMESSSEGGHNAAEYTRILAGLGGAGAGAGAGSGSGGNGFTTPAAGGAGDPDDSGGWHGELTGTASETRKSRKLAGIRLATTIAEGKGIGGSGRGVQDFLGRSAAMQAERAAEAADRIKANPWTNLQSGLTDALGGPLSKMPGGILNAFRSAQGAADVSMGGWNGAGGKSPLDGLKAFGGAARGFFDPRTRIAHWLAGMGGGGGSGAVPPGLTGGGFGGGGPGGPGPEGAAGFAANLPALGKALLNGPIGKFFGAPFQAITGAANVVGTAGRNVIDPHSKPLASMGEVAGAGVGAAGGVGGAMVGAAIGGPIGGIIGGVVGKTIVEPIGKAVGGLIGLPEKINEFGTALIRNTEHLRRFDAGINEVHARMERQQLLLDRQTAIGTSGSTQELGKSLMELRKELQPIAQDWQNVQNKFAEKLAQLVTIGLKLAKMSDEALKSADPGWRAVRGIWDYFAKSEPGQGNNAFVDFLNDVANEKWRGRPLNQRPGEKEDKKKRLKP